MLWFMVNTVLGNPEPSRHHVGTGLWVGYWSLFGYWKLEPGYFYQFKPLPLDLTDTGIVALAVTLRHLCAEGTSAYSVKVAEIFLLGRPASCARGASASGRGGKDERTPMNLFAFIRVIP
jgi:hypothetical protein